MMAAPTPAGAGGRPSQLVEQTVVLVGTEPQIAQDLPQERPDEYRRSVIRNDDDPAFGVPEYDMASPAPDRCETRLLCNRDELVERREAEPRQAATSTRQVPTNSVTGPSGSTVSR